MKSITLLIASIIFIFSARESYAMKAEGNATAFIENQYVVSNSVQYKKMDYLKNAFVYTDNVENVKKVTIVAF